MMFKEIKENAYQSSGELMAQQENLAVLQKIGAEIEAKRNAPQELWTALREFMVADMANVPLGLQHDVIEFCLAVFDSLEPNVTNEERQKRIAHVDALAVLLNFRIMQAAKGLSEKDNAFLVTWNIVSNTTCMIAISQVNPNVGLVLAPFGTFDMELQKVDQPELVLAVWLYSLYTTIFAAVFGTIPAGILGLASLGVGLSVRETKGMV